MDPIFVAAYNDRGKAQCKKQKADQRKAIKDKS
jgi:hypothetical protein